MIDQQSFSSTVQERGFADGIIFPEFRSIGYLDFRKVDFPVPLGPNKK
jgi:hypothetical protein